MGLPSALSSLSPQKFPQRKFLIFFLKKTYSENVSSIFSKKPPEFSGNETFLYFGKGIFRTLTYLELEAYSELWYIQNPRHMAEHCQTPTMGSFAKNKY